MGHRFGRGDVIDMLEEYLKHTGHADDGTGEIRAIRKPHIEIREF